MKINGLDGSVYDVSDAPDTSALLDAIIQIDGSLVYVGSDITLAYTIDLKTVDVHISFGFEWDGASIPGFAQWIVGKPLDSEFRIASLLHDAGYDDRSTRVLHDVIFFHSLRQADVPLWKSALMFAAVRLGGHVYYASETSRFWRFIKRLMEQG